MSTTLNDTEVNNCFSIYQTDTKNWFNSFNIPKNGRIELLKRHFVSLAARGWIALAFHSPLWYIPNIIIVIKIIFTVKGAFTLIPVFTDSLCPNQVSHSAWAYPGFRRMRLPQHFIRPGVPDNWLVSMHTPGRGGRGGRGERGERGEAQWNRSVLLKNTSHHPARSST